MGDRVLRPRVRSGPYSFSLTGDREKVTYSAGRRRHTALSSTVQQRVRKKVVFSSKRYTSDDLVANGRTPRLDALTDDATPVVGILKHSPDADLADGDLGPSLGSSTPTGRKRVSKAAPRKAARRATKHASFTEEARESPWRSASSSILAALALSVSPLARKRAEQAERLARGDEGVRRVVHFYKSAGEWWNVFPKTDYSHSPMSPFHQEISPGVMTMPNMSRPGLYSSPSLLELNRKSQFVHYSDDFGSDSDEVDDVRPPSQFPNAWMRVCNVFWTTATSILAFMLSVMKNISEHVYMPKRKPAHFQKTPRYYSYTPRQETTLSRMWTLIQEFFHESYCWVSQRLKITAQSSWRPNNPSIHRKRSGLAPFLLVIPFILLFLGWWCWGDDSLLSIMEKMQHFMKSSGSLLWSILIYPFVALYSVLFQIWATLTAVVTTSLHMLPSLTSSLLNILYDVCKSPFYLVQSVLSLLVELGGTIISLFQMVLAPLFSFKAGLWDSSKYSTVESESHFHPANEAQRSSLQDFLNAALQSQEASLLSKLSESEQNLLTKMTAQEARFRAEMAAKDGFTQQLNARVLYLQDELHRWRRRFFTCCRHTPTLGIMKEQLKEELKKLLLSREGLVMLGAAAAHASPADKSPATIPQFNDTAIRAWVTSAFLDKDDFEKTVENITKYFNEELERRSATMMAASTEEINARIARQHQVHLTQMSKLQAELSDTYSFHTPHSGTIFSSGETASPAEDDRIRKIVESALAVYDADKTGMADYALESQGGEVVSTRCSETYQVKSPTLSVFGVPLWYPSNSPRTVIQPGMHPGECWAFVGSQGFLVIKLSHQIRVKGFTYEHISPVLLPTGKMDSAPKDFSVYGLRSEGDNDPILLGNYHYHQNGTSMQYFPVQHLGVQPLQLIEIQVKSNHEFVSPFGA